MIDWFMTTMIVMAMMMIIILLLMTMTMMISMAMMISMTMMISVITMTGSGNQPALDVDALLRHQQVLQFLQNPK